MIGFILLVIASASLVAPGCAQDYDEVRPVKGRYRGNYDNDDAVLAKPAPAIIPILKQIDRHNDDGSYTYGFESADGSFKIETKQADGEVKGKYGYTDADGKLHVVEYGANKFGFMPAGEGITVPPINFNAEPEEEEEEFPRRNQPKLQPRPRPQPQPQSQLQYRPAVQQLQPWEQDLAAAPAPRPQQQQQQLPQPAVRAPLRTQVIVPQSRPRPQAEPHIIYNSPAPKKPAFFAGAQPVPEAAQAINYDYEEPVVPQRPAKPVRAQTLALTSNTKQQQPSFFVPSSEFRQEIQFSQQSSKVARPAPPQFNDDDSQYYRPEPVKQQFRQFAEPAPRAYTAPKAVAKSKGGFLDQLQEQYSLPSGGQPTHNIAFGFY